MLRRLRILALTAVAGLLCACQVQEQSPREGAYVDFVMEMMVTSAERSDGPSDSAPAVQAVEGLRGGAEGGGAD